MSEPEESHDQPDEPRPVRQRHAKPDEPGPPGRGTGWSTDREQLRLLAIFHYVVAGLSAFCACFPVLYLILGIKMLSGEFGPPGAPPPPEFAWIFILFSAAMILAGWALAIGLLVAARCLSQRRGYTYCLVLAAISCLFMPVGTVLGVFTIIVLVRPSVRELFGVSPADFY